MSKLTYLQLTNRVLSRINESTIADVSTATGKALIVTQLINEAQNALFTEANWYSLYKTRLFATVSYTSVGGISFVENGATADTILDASSGFVTAGFTAGMEVLISGSTSNDKVAIIDTVAAGTLTLNTVDDLANETATAGSVTITALTYPYASDFGRAISLIDTTNNSIIEETFMRSIDEVDPGVTSSGNPTHFSSKGSFYVFYPYPAGTNYIREKYWQLPDTLSVNTDTSDLPIEVENCIIYYALSAMLNYLQKYESADRMWAIFNKQFNRAQVANKRKIDIMLRFQSDSNRGNPPPWPRLPSNYGS